jgi:hypothetical protein
VVTYLLGWLEVGFGRWSGEPRSFVEFPRGVYTLGAFGFLMVCCSDSHNTLSIMRFHTPSLLCFAVAVTAQHTFNLTQAYALENFGKYRCLYVFISFHEHLAASSILFGQTIGSH